MQTQQMIAQGEWRVRSTADDNAPYGREVHWASPLRWWLGFLAWGDHVLNGRPLGVAVERASLWSGPLIFVLLVAPLVVFVAKRFSTIAAALTALGAVAFLPFYLDFLPGRPDHHVLANFCGAALLLSLIVGSRAEGAVARRWFAASGMAGGLGLWISASAQASVLVGVGFGVMVAAWIARGGTRGISWLEDPSLWRLWGMVGGGMSLVAYAIEYFPDRLGLRLEVNHPLYAAAWMGAGESLRLVVLSCRDGFRPALRQNLAAVVVSLILVLPLPAIIVATGATTFTVADPFIWQLHVLYISEFLGLARTLADHGWGLQSIELCLPVLMLALPLWLGFHRRTAPNVRAVLVLALVPALWGWVLGWHQMRWLGLAYVLSVPALAMSFRILQTPEGRSARLRTGWMVAGTLVYLPGMVLTVQRALAASDFTTEEIRQLAVRDVAHTLRLRGGKGQVVVASSPATTSRLIFSGGLTGLGTLYWENAEGLKNASSLFAASSVGEAREIVQRLAVTHIVVLSWDPFEVEQARLIRGLSGTTLIRSDLFIANLLAAPVPPRWLRAVPFPLPDHPVLQGKQVRIWEVVPNQTPIAALGHAVNYYLELGMPDVAVRFVPSLARFSDDLVASVMLAAVASRQRDETSFKAALAQVLGQLSQAAGLTLEEHVHLTVVLAVGQREDLAREQLRLAVGKADDPSVRHLSPGALADLLSLCDALMVRIPDPALRQLAQGLLRPDKRP